jgi:hypothetical protein
MRAHRRTWLTLWGTERIWKDYLRCLKILIINSFLVKITILAHKINRAPYLQGRAVKLRARCKKGSKPAKKLSLLLKKWRSMDLKIMQVLHKICLQLLTHHSRQSLHKWFIELRQVKIMFRLIQMPIQLLVLGKSLYPRRPHITSSRNRKTLFILVHSRRVVEVSVPMVIPYLLIKVENLCKTLWELVFTGWVTTDLQIIRRHKDLSHLNLGLRKLWINMEALI